MCVQISIHICGGYFSVAGSIFRLILIGHVGLSAGVYRVQVLYGEPEALIYLCVFISPLILLMNGRKEMVLYCPPHVRLVIIDFYKIAAS